MKGLGIIGCGAIGSKRAAAIGSDWKLVGCADLDLKKAEAIAGPSSYVSADWRDLLIQDEIDAVVVSTLHDSLAEISSQALLAGKHVLVEKPAARNIDELSKVMSAVKQSGMKFRVGLNHRYHRAMSKAKDLLEKGELGELMFIRGRYGHGGRLGYDNEWRADPVKSGGGELIDQGPHLIDLCRWFFGEEFVEVKGAAHTYYWSMPVDDNAFLHLVTERGKTAFLHVSCSEWKNLFSIEIYGKLGKLEINGLGGSYGLERLTWYRMLPQMGPPETTIWEFPMADESWSIEMAEFSNDIKLDRMPSPGIEDAFRVLKVVQTVYEESGYDFCP